MLLREGSPLGALWEAFGKAVSLINVVLLVGKL